MPQAWFVGDRLAVAHLKPRCKHEHHIVKHMGCHGCPQAACPYKQVAEICSEKHAGHKAEQLEMERAEYDCYNPYGHVAIDAAGGKKALQAPSE